MNDKELLELAAKAAELPECGWMGPAFMYVKDNMFTEWNPLTDDGDAFRLAVKLNLGVSIPVHQTICADVVCFRDSSVNVREEGSDPYAATRRAIVRAAAGIFEHPSQKPVTP